MITRIVAAALFTLTPAVFAQTYIVPEGQCGAVTLHATRGADFPSLGKSIDPDRVVRAYVHLPHRRIVVKPTAGAKSLDVNAELSDPELVIAAIDFAPEAVANETHTDHAKAFVRCGSASNFGLWRTSSGLGLEIYPQWNDQLLKKGQRMRFIVVDGVGNKLLRDVPMDLYLAGVGHVGTAAPDENGGMMFPYDQPGLYMVVATWRRVDPNNPGHWFSDTSTLTFEMK